MWLPRRTAGSAHIERRRTPRTNLACDKPLTIMVVDDNVDAARTLGMLLQAAGHRVITEHDPRRALDVARIELPDVCVLDIGLPGMDGNEMARRLRACPATAGLLLVALTGYCQAHDRDQSLQAGFDIHMTKPLDVARLQSVLAARTAQP